MMAALEEDSRAAVSEQLLSAIKAVMATPSTLSHSIIDLLTPTGQQPSRASSPAGHTGEVQASIIPRGAAATQQTPNLASDNRSRNVPPGDCKLRGVTRHRRTQRFEAHIWEDRHQVYLGGYDMEEHAAKAHDILALKNGRSLLNYEAGIYEPLHAVLGRLSSAAIVDLLRRYSRETAAEERRSEKQALAGIISLSRSPKKEPVAAMPRGKRAAPYTAAAQRNGSRELEESAGDGGQGVQLKKEPANQPRAKRARKRTPPATPDVPLAPGNWQMRSGVSLGVRPDVVQRAGRKKRRRGSDSDSSETETEDDADDEDYSEGSRSRGKCGPLRGSSKGLAGVPEARPAVTPQLPWSAGVSSCSRQRLDLLEVQKQQHLLLQRQTVKTGGVQMQQQQRQLGLQQQQQHKQQQEPLPASTAGRSDWSGGALSPGLFAARACAASAAAALKPGHARQQATSPSWSAGTSVKQDPACRTAPALLTPFAPIKDAQSPRTSWWGGSSRLGNRVGENFSQRLLQNLQDSGPQHAPPRPSPSAYWKQQQEQLQEQQQQQQRQQRQQPTHLQQGSQGREKGPVGSRAGAAEGDAPDTTAAARQHVGCGLLAALQTPQGSPSRLPTGSSRQVVPASSPQRLLPPTSPPVTMLTSSHQWGGSPLGVWSPSSASGLLLLGCNVMALRAAALAAQQGFGPIASGGTAGPSAVAGRSVVTAGEQRDSPFASAGSAGQIAAAAAAAAAAGSPRGAAGGVTEEIEAAATAGAAIAAIAAKAAATAAPEKPAAGAPHWHQSSHVNDLRSAERLPPGGAVEIFGSGASARSASAAAVGGVYAADAGVAASGAAPGRAAAGGVGLAGVGVAGEGGGLAGATGVGAAESGATAGYQQSLASAQRRKMTAGTAEAGAERRLPGPAGGSQGETETTKGSAPDNGGGGDICRDADGSRGHDGAGCGDEASPRWGQVDEGGDTAPKRTYLGTSPTTARETSPISSPAVAAITAGAAAAGTPCSVIRKMEPEFSSVADPTDAAAPAAANCAAAVPTAAQAERQADCRHLSRQSAASGRDAEDNVTGDSGVVAPARVEHSPRVAQEEPSLPSLMPAATCRGPAIRPGCGSRSAFCHLSEAATASAPQHRQQLSGPAEREQSGRREQQPQQQCSPHRPSSVSSLPLLLQQQWKEAEPPLAEGVDDTLACLNTPLFRMVMASCMPPSALSGIDLGCGGNWSAADTATLDALQRECLDLLHSSPARGKASHTMHLLGASPRSIPRDPAPISRSPAPTSCIPPVDPSHPAAIPSLCGPAALATLYPSSSPLLCTPCTTSALGAGRNGSNSRVVVTELAASGPHQSSSLATREGQHRAALSSEGWDTTPEDPLHKAQQHVAQAGSLTPSPIAAPHMHPPPPAPAPPPPPLGCSSSSGSEWSMSPTRCLGLPAISGSRPEMEAWVQHFMRTLKPPLRPRPQAARGAGDAGGVRSDHITPLWSAMASPQSRQRPADQPPKSPSVPDFCAGLAMLAGSARATPTMTPAAVVLAVGQHDLPAPSSPPITAQGGAPSLERVECCLEVEPEIPSGSAPAAASPSTKPATVSSSPLFAGPCRSRAGAAGRDLPHGYPTMAEETKADGAEAMFALVPAAGPALSSQLISGPHQSHIHPAATLPPQAAHGPGFSTVQNCLLLQSPSQRAPREVISEVAASVHSAAAARAFRALDCSGGATGEGGCEPGWVLQPCLVLLPTNASVEEVEAMLRPFLVSRTE